MHTSNFMLSNIDESFMKDYDILPKVSGLSRKNDMPHSKKKGYEYPAVLINDSWSGRSYLGSLKNFVVSVSEKEKYE